jgi:Calx-beta domain
VTSIPPTPTSARRSRRRIPASTSAPTATPRARSTSRASCTPFIYDRSVTSNGTPILSFTDNSAALASALQGQDVRFTGAAAVAANGAVAPKLYAPASWQSGSSYSHLDEGTYPAGNANSLMTPAIGPNEVIHSPGSITLGIFSDSGWTIGGLPTMSIGSARLVEGNSGIRKLRANVTLSNPVPWTVTATFATANSTATGGSDFTAAIGTVTIPAGATFATPAFTIVSDRVTEASEKFTVLLSSPSGAVLGGASTSLYILNDDPSSGVSISAGTASVGEGNLGDRVVSLTLSLSLTKTKPITVDWATGSGTATAGDDYDAASGTVTFAPGAAYARVQVTIHPDTDAEGAETIPIVLSNAVGAPIARPIGTISITNDD